MMISAIVIRDNILFKNARVIITLDEPCSQQHLKYRSMVNKSHIP